MKDEDCEWLACVDSGLSTRTTQMEQGEQTELVANIVCDIGENPLWHPDTQSLFFLDISAGIVYSYTPATQELRQFSKGPVTGGMVLQEDGTILLFQDGRISTLSLDGTQREVACELCPGNDRFNDVIADPEGRVFAGALGGRGRLYRIDRDGAAVKLFEGFGIPNGMGFTGDAKSMYFIDSQLRRIYLFDYERSTGNLFNRRVFADIPEAEGLPDGMTRDAEGCIWVALWFGSRVKRYKPDGTLDREVYLRVTQVTAVAFGGPDLSDIYVTSAASKISDAMKPPGYDETAPRGGGLYHIRVSGVTGRPLYRSRIQFK